MSKKNTQKALNYQQYTKKALKKKVNEILALATSDMMLEELRAVLETPEAQQLNEASIRFSAENLSAKGLKISANTRISSRIFDESTGMATVLGGDTSDMSFNLDVPKDKFPTIKLEDLVDKKKMLEEALKNGWSACLCVGAGGCVGVGGGT